MRHRIVPAAVLLLIAVAAHAQPRGVVDGTYVFFVSKSEREQETARRVCEERDGAACADARFTTSSETSARRSKRTIRPATFDFGDVRRANPRATGLVVANVRRTGDSGRNGQRLA
jgi:hypothetical protein